MIKEVHNNCSIECQSAEIISRKILPSSFIENKSLGRCITYNCSRNSEAVILKELKKKKPIFNVYSLLKLNSKLECDRLYVIISAKKPYKLKLINHTATHKAQMFITKEFTYAKISRQINNIPLLDPPRIISIPKVAKSSIKKIPPPFFL